MSTLFRSSALTALLLGSSAYADEAPPAMGYRLPGDVEFKAIATQPCAWVLGNDMKWKEVNCIDAAQALAATMTRSALTPWDWCSTGPIWRARKDHVCYMEDAPK